MNSYGLTGYPLGHSLSPLIHSELLKISGIDGDYRLYEIAPENFGREIEKLKSLRGFNVTIPHKISVIPYLDELDEKAALFGAVNTVKCSEKAKGFNTDCAGFLRALESANIDLNGNVLVCGAGGVARMFAFEAALAGCCLTIAARESDIPAAEKIRNEIKEKLNRDARVSNIDNISDGYDLIINGTPVGMFPNIDASILSKKIIGKSKAAFDAVYNPEETLFLKYARESGLKYSNGLPMLVWQAAVAEEIWNGTEFSESDIAKVIELCRRK